LRDGAQLITDGPYAETKEQMGGFDIIDCADLDEPSRSRPRSGGPLRDGRGAAVLDGVKEAVAAACPGTGAGVVAAVIRQTGDWDLAEECAQDAFERALETWPRDGVPRARPG